MNFADRVVNAVQEKKNAICVGIDPNIELMPLSVRTGDSIEAVRVYCTAIIDAVCTLVPSVKFQSAYFEQLGGAGMVLMQELIAHARNAGLIVIADVKRGDIGQTSTAYAQAYLGDGGFHADALTVAPYMGSDSVQPFIEQAAKTESGVFILVKTSNTGSEDIQDIRIDGSSLYEQVAKLVTQWGSALVGTSGYSAVGAVVGATYPRQLKDLRRMMPAQLLLVPGYGAQGAAATDVVDAFDAKGNGALIVAARSVMYAYRNRPDLGEVKYQQAASEAVLQMAADIETAKRQ